jgi:hypothetical protein
MLVTELNVAREELHSILCVLRARGLVILCEPPPESGIFRAGAFGARRR